MHVQVILGLIFCLSFSVYASLLPFAFLAYVVLFSKAFKALSV